MSRWEWSRICNRRWRVRMRWMLMKWMRRARKLMCKSEEVEQE